MSKKMPLVFLALFGLAITGSHAQKLFKKANKQFEVKAYNLAISNYHKSLLEEDANNDLAKLKLAESYRKTNRPIEAVQWYRKVGPTVEKHPSHYLNYAHTLKSIGKYDEAQEMYWGYKENDPIIGEHYAQSCEFAKNNLKDVEKFDLLLFGANSKYSDFGVSFYHGKVVFSSFRKSLDGVVGDRKDQHISARSKNRLVYAISDNPSMNDPLHLLRDAIKEDENMGPISYATNLSRCAYSKNEFKNGFDFVGIKDNDLSIYLAEANEDGDFTDEIPFKHNEIGYATGFPCLAFGGSALYFSSNRPGGFGGYDVYVSYYKNGEWTYPENLGGQINSTGNEITPHFDGKHLYFSSDYHHGLGGFDIFKSKVVDGEWTFAQNMGNGVNSLSDDYFFAVNPNTKDYYFSSNRLGGRGKDDIYIATPLNQDDLLVFEDVLIPTAVNLNDMQKTDAMATNAKRVSEEVNVPKAFKLSDLGTDQVKAIPPSAKIEDSAATAVVPERVKISDYQKTDEVPERVKLPTAKTEGIANPEVTSTSARESEVRLDAELNTARLVAINEILNAQDDVYFIQVAALFRNKVNLADYEPLTKYGNLYKIYKTNSTKIRLGFYLNRTEAEAVLQDVRNLGFRDAFIAHEPLDLHEVQLAVESAGDSDPYASNYKVRLASYEEPQFFDLASVKDLGKIEQWTKKGWTIFVLSGYRSLDDAESARVKAINRGYVSAELVIDNGGVLERLVKN